MNCLLLKVTTTFKCKRIKINLCIMKSIVQNLSESDWHCTSRARTLYSKCLKPLALYTYGLCPYDSCYEIYNFLNVFSWICF